MNLTEQINLRVSPEEREALFALAGKREASKLLRSFIRQQAEQAGVWPVTTNERKSANGKDR